MSEQDMAEMYSKLADGLKPHVDIFLVETMAKFAHARAAVAAAAPLGVPHSAFTRLHRPLHSASF